MQQRPGPDDPLVQAYAHERFVEMFLSQNRRAQTGLFLAALLVAFVWWEATRSWAAPAWAGAALLVTAARYRFTQGFVRAVQGQARTQRIVFVLVVNGLLMATPLLAFGAFSELERAAVSIILLATATASVATTSGFRRVFVAYAAPMLLPLALAWALVGVREASGAAWGLAGLVLFFQLFLLSVGQQASGVFMEACTFRHGEQLLNRELSNALAEAGEANRAKTQFLAAASHDLRQPLHTMNVLVAALGLRELEPQARRIVGLLGNVNQMLTKQLDTLLDMSKLDAGVFQAEFVVQPLAPLLRNHHAATAPVARERGLELLLDIAPEAEASGGSVVLTDAALLMRAVSNLTDNAFKFTPTGGRVTLGLHVQDGHAVLSVADSGIGIAPEEHQRVFREFYRVGNVERDRLKGLGLGLAIVRRLCELLGVAVDLQSAPGQGTTIALKLPLVQRAVVPADAAAARADTDTAQAPSAPALQGLRVLVVDDEAMVRQSMALLLANLGCTVHLAEGLEAAEHVAAGHPLDLVLADFRLRDGASGLAAIRAVAAAQPRSRAILITGDTAPDRLREARAAGVPLLYKPVTMSALIAAIPVTPA
jgi:signal transduction histidine kinase